MDSQLRRLQISKSCISCLPNSCIFASNPSAEKRLLGFWQVTCCMLLQAYQQAHFNNLVQLSSSSLRLQSPTWLLASLIRNANRHLAHSLISHGKGHFTSCLPSHPASQGPLDDSPSPERLFEFLERENLKMR